MEFFTAEIDHEDDNGGVYIKVEKNPDPAGPITCLYSGYIPAPGDKVIGLRNGASMIILGPPDKGFRSDFPPPAPTGLRASGVIGGLFITWNEAHDPRVAANHGYYRLQIDVADTFNTDQFAEMDVVGTNYYLAGLDNNKPLYVRVQAVSDDGLLNSPFTPVVEGIPNLDQLTQQIGAEHIRAIIMEVDNYISSHSYVQGVSGWIIHADGSAELNNVIVRGTIKASSIVSSQITTTEGANFLPNGTFDANVNGWTPTGCTATRDPLVLRSGTASMKLTTNPPGQPQIEVVSDYLPVSPDTEYVVRCAARPNSDVRTMNVIMEWYDDDHNDRGFALLPKIEQVVGQWAYYALAAPSDHLTTLVRIRIQFNNCSNGEIHHIDDVSIREGSLFIGRVATAAAGPRSELQLDINGDPRVAFYTSQDGLISPSYLKSNVDIMSGRTAIELVSPDYAGAPQLAWLRLSSDSFSDPNTWRSELWADASHHYFRSPEGQGKLVANFDDNPVVVLADHKEIRGNNDNQPYTMSSNVFADVDAANLRCTFAVPESGIVIAELAAAVKIANATSLQFGLRDLSNVTVPNSEMTVLEIVGGYVRVNARVTITGLTPTVVTTWKWTWRTKTNAVTISMGKGPTLGTAEMRVWKVLS